MIRVITFLFLLSNLFYSQEKLPITINDYGLIFIKAKVNNEIGTFILDTGSGAHVVSQKFYSKIKNSTKEDGVYTGFRHNGERIDLKVYKARSISVRSLIQTNPFIGVYPKLDEYGIDGLVSLKLFEENAFTIDFVNKQVIIETVESLSQIEKTAEILPIQFDRERDKVLDMFVTICINDSVSLQAEFDTGSGYETFFLNKYYADKFNLQLDSLKRTNISKLIFCGSNLSIENKPTTIKDDLIYEGLIGSGLFRNKRLTIDIPNKRILFR